MLPHRQAASEIFDERLVVLADTTAELAQAGLGALADLAAKLGAMSGDIRGHLDERATNSGTG